jgi:hypothetical protein
MLAILQESAACYIILSLTATSLAKLVNWRTSAIAVLREGLVPARFASFAVISVSAVEMSLAAFLCFGMAGVLISYAAILLFVLFGAYRLAVAVRTKSLMCTCAGYARYNPATPRALAGVIFASTLQAAIASTLMFPAIGYNANNATLARSIVWSIPFVILIIGTCVARTVRLIRPERKLVFAPVARRLARRSGSPSEGAGEAVVSATRAAPARRTEP